MGLSELDLSPCTVLALAEERVWHGLGPCGTWRTRARRRVALAEDGRTNAVHRLALSGTGLGQWHTGFRRWSSRVQGDATSVDSVYCNEDRQRAGGTGVGRGRGRVLTLDGLWAAEGAGGCVLILDELWAAEVTRPGRQRISPVHLFCNPKTATPWRG